MSMYNISDAELLIMQVIWAEGGNIFLADLMKRLGEMGKSWKANTVLTFLSRLVEKDMLAIEKHGRLNRYVALHTESQHTEYLTQSFLGKFFNGDAKSLVASLLRQECLTPNDVAELQEFWKGKKDESIE